MIYIIVIIYNANYMMQLHVNIIIIINISMNNVCHKIIWEC